MALGKNLVDELKLEIVASAIEDKFIERGILRSQVGSDFDLSIKVVNGTKDNNFRFTIRIFIFSEEIDALDDDSVDRIVDTVEDAFFRQVSFEKTDEISNELHNYFYESELILNSEKIY